MPKQTKQNPALYQFLESDHLMIFSLTTLTRVLTKPLELISNTTKDIITRCNLQMHKRRRWKKNISKMTHILTQKVFGLLNQSMELRLNNIQIHQMTDLMWFSNKDSLLINTQSLSKTATTENLKAAQSSESDFLHHFSKICFNLMLKSELSRWLIK